MTATVTHIATKRQKPADHDDLHCQACDCTDFKLRYKDSKPAGMVCTWCGEKLPAAVWRFDLGRAS